MSNEAQRPRDLRERITTFPPAIDRECLALSGDSNDLTVADEEALELLLDVSGARVDPTALAAALGLDLDTTIATVVRLASWLDRASGTPIALRQVVGAGALRLAEVPDPDVPAEP